MADDEMTTHSFQNAPLRLSDAAEESFEQGERFGSRWRHLAKASPGQPYKVGFVIEELSPGKQTAPAHYHTREEEHVYILEGTLTVRIGKDMHIMEAGDYVRFPAGVPQEHCLFNRSNAVCRYVLVGEKDRHDVTVYPDSGKIKVDIIGEIYDKRSIRAYWDGEA
jgi:uncharacterized cupin superfamily protein